MGGVILAIVWKRKLGAFQWAFPAMWTEGRKSQTLGERTNRTAEETEGGFLGSYQHSSFWFQSLPEPQLHPWSTPVSSNEFQCFVDPTGEAKPLLKTGILAVGLRNEPRGLLSDLNPGASTWKQLLTAGGFSGQHWLETRLWVGQMS